MKQYPKYKTIRGHWIHCIPSDWAMDPVKRNYDIQLGKMLQNRKESGDDMEIQYFKAQHVQWHSVRKAELPKMWASPMEIKKYGVQTGDLLVCEGGEGGRCGIVHSLEEEAIIQNALHRVRSKGANINRFLEYTMKAISSVGWFDAINNKATIAHFTRDKFGKLLIPLPPPDEQAAIVKYLDHMTRRIDKAIRAKKKLIQLLNEQKQVIIHQTVTKGLDPNVPMKDSGVTWLGKVPLHWKVIRAKYLFREVNMGSKEGKEELLSVSHITGVTPRSEKNVTMFKASSYVGHKVCEPGDVVINTMWAWMGALGVSFNLGIVSPAYGVYRPIKRGVLTDLFTHYLLRLKPYIDEYTVNSTGIQSSRRRLYPEEFLRIRVVCPPIEEQNEIIEFILRESESIVKTERQFQRQIELLQEYRTRLIADVVTGQIDVRELAAQLPDEQEDVEPFELDDVEEEILETEQDE